MARNYGEFIQGESMLKRKPDLDIKIAPEPSTEPNSVDVLNKLLL